MASAMKQTNLQTAVKRMYVDPNDSASEITLCDGDILIVAVLGHACEEAVQAKDTASKMKEDAVKKSDDTTKGTKRQTEAKSTKQVKKPKGKDPNKPKRPASGFLIFMETFRKTFKDANPESKGVAAAAKAGGERWMQMSDEEKASYNRDASARKVAYEQAVTKYKNADPSQDDGGEVSEVDADDEEEADVEDA